MEEAGGFREKKMKMNRGWSLGVFGHAGAVELIYNGLELAAASSRHCTM